MRILSLNIASASVERAEAILSWLKEQDADVLVLSEISSGDGTDKIIDCFRLNGWMDRVGVCKEKELGVAIFTRCASQILDLRPTPDPLGSRAVILSFDSSPSINIVGMYIPNRGKDPEKLNRKLEYLKIWGEHLCTLGKAYSTMVIGDLNIVPPIQHPIFLPQIPIEDKWYNDLQNKAGYLDVALNCLGKYEQTWVAHTGEGYTYDHAFVTKDLRKYITSFSYIHDTRKLKISDHSALMLELNIECRLLEVVKLHDLFIGNPQMSLF